MLADGLLRRVIRVGIGIVAGAGAAIAAPPAIAAPADRPAKPLPPALGGPLLSAAHPPPSARPTHKGPDSRTVPALIEQGESAMALGDAKAARDAFRDVIELEPKNAVALAGLGYAYLQLEDIPRAKTYLDQAVVLTPKPSKTLVINAASVLLRTRNAMRAAKFVKDYMDDQPVVDGDCLDALGTCLSQADEQTRGQRFFQECVKFYEASAAKLEAGRPGQKRWGSEWLTAAAADQKLAQYRQTLAEMDRQNAAMSRARAAFSAAEAAKRRALFGARRRIDTTAFDLQMQAADRDYQDANGLLQAAAGQLQRPPFAAAIPAVAPDDTPTALAAAPPAAPPLRPSTAAPPTAAPSPGASRPPPTPPAAGGLTPVGSTGAGAAGAAPPAARPPVRPAPAAPRPKARSVTTYAAAFAVAPTLLVTSAAAVAGADSVMVQPSDGDPMPAKVLRTDPQSGLALLELTGRRMAHLALADAFAGGAIQCVSFPKVSVFDPVAEGISGSAAAPKADDWTVRLARHPRLPGGPLLSAGKVVGVQLSTRDSDLAAVPAATLDDLKRLIGAPPAPSANPNPAAVTLQVTATRDKPAEATPKS